MPRGLLPFPPLPALLLVPFVAVWGLATDDQLLFTVLAAVDVGLAWWMLGRLPVGPAVRLGTTVFFAFGTVFWYTAQQSTTWFQAHVVAVGLTFLAIGLALGADRDAAATEPDAVDGPDATIRRPTPPAGSRAAPAAADRSPPARGRVPVRAGLHGADAGRLRGAVLRLRRCRRGLARPCLVGRRWAPRSRSWPCSPTT